MTRFGGRSGASPRHFGAKKRTATSTRITIRLPSMFGDSMQAIVEVVSMDAAAAQGGGAAGTP
jgi:hypothetical protein